jgi:hypothetical protein
MILIYLHADNGGKYLDMFDSLVSSNKWPTECSDDTTTIKAHGNVRICARELAGKGRCRSTFQAHLSILKDHKNVS